MCRCTYDYVTPAKSKDIHTAICNGSNAWAQLVTVSLRDTFNLPATKLAAKLGVGMAVYRQDMLYKGYTSNPIPTSIQVTPSLHPFYT